MYDTTYTHVQETANNNWVVDHNLNTEAPICDVIIEDNGTFKKIIPLEVTVNNANRCTISFTEPRIGTVRVV